MDDGIFATIIVFEPSTNQRKRKRDENSWKIKWRKIYWEVIKQGVRTLGRNRKTFSKTSPICSRKFCKKSKKRRCDELNDGNCQVISCSYWSSSDGKIQNTFIQCLVDEEEKSVVSSESRRSSTLCLSFIKGWEIISCL